tara:strand:+ start:99 stop:527 length:429 start_codon:yes stop_codon:yes gene_type:complete
MKRQERNRKYRRIIKRLDEYGNWYHSKRGHLGRNVSDPQQENPTRVQNRNDLYSNPTAQDVEDMDYDDRRALTTETALNELDRGMYALLMVQHVHDPEIDTDSELSGKTGYPRRHIGRDMAHAYKFVESHIGMLIRMQKKAA